MLYVIPSAYMEWHPRSGKTHELPEVHQRSGQKVPRSRRYRMVGKGYPICLVFLKLFEKVYAPLTAGLPAPFRGDHVLVEQKRCQLARYRGANENFVPVASNMQLAVHGSKVRSRHGCFTRLFLGAALVGLWTFLG
jgi:hypothetical protein